MQRIPDPDELLGGSRPTALLVGLSGGKVWRAEVSRDGYGAFLGRGWPEFAAAHGLAAPARGGSWRSGTTAAACSPSRRSTPADASGRSALRPLVNFVLCSSCSQDKVKGKFLTCR